MSDIPLWLLVLVAMVGILAVSLLVYVLLPRNRKDAEPGVADERVRMPLAPADRAPPPAPAPPPAIATPELPIPDGEPVEEARVWSPPRHPELPVEVMPEQAPSTPAAQVGQRDGPGRHALPEGGVQPVAPEPPGPVAAEQPAPETEPPRNGVGHVQSPAIRSAPTEPEPAAPAPSEPRTHNGEPPPGRWTPTVPSTVGAPSAEALATWAAPDVPAAPTPDDRPFSSSALFEPVVAPEPVPAEPDGAPTGTDPAMSALAALGWSQGAPMAPANDVAQQAEDDVGSAPPTADGSAPSQEFTVKANEGSMRYYTPDSPYYLRTRADVWFRSSSDAERAGFTPWNLRRR